MTVPAQPSRGSGASSAKPTSALRVEQGEVHRDQVKAYQLAREVLGQRIRDLLVASHETEDAAERAAIDAQIADLSKQRGALEVGSAEVAALAASAPKIPGKR